MCHGACPPRVEEHTTALQKMQYNYHPQYQCVGQRKKAPCVYLYHLTKHQTSIHTHACAKAQPLTARARWCSGDPLRECPVTIAYHRHHPSSFRFIDCVGAGLMQGLIGGPSPPPIIYKIVKKHLLFPSYNYVY